MFEKDLVKWQEICNFASVFVAHPVKLLKMMQLAVI